MASHTPFPQDILIAGSYKTALSMCDITVRFDLPATESISYDEVLAAVPRAYTGGIIESACQVFCRNSCRS